MVRDTELANVNLGEGNRQMRPLVLISSQDLDFFLVFSHILEVDGLASELAESATEAIQKAAGTHTLAVILDCKPDDRSSPDLCAQLKRDPATREKPVIALIAPEALSLHIDLLKAGIDETFVRPFPPLKLLTYLQSKVAPPDPAMQEQVLSYGAIELNEYTHRVHVSGQEIHLPPIEFKLLRRMLQRPHKVFTRAELIEAAWRGDMPGDERGVDVHIARLRKAVRRVSKQEVIRTVRSAGYALLHQSGKAEARQVDH